MFDSQQDLWFSDETVLLPCCQSPDKVAFPEVRVSQIQNCGHSVSLYQLPQISDRKVSVTLASSC